MDSLDQANNYLKTLFPDRVFMLVTCKPVDDGTGKKIDVNVRVNTSASIMHELLQPVMVRLKEDAEKEVQR